MWHDNHSTERRNGLGESSYHKFLEATDLLSSDKFRLSFPVHQKKSPKLENLTPDKLVRDERMRAKQNGVVELEVRIAIVLSILSGSSYLGMMLIWNVSRCTMFTSVVDIFHQTLSFDNFTSKSTACSRYAAQFECSRPEYNLHPV